ncbi:MAG: FAD-binding oxidoreductase [Phycisphaerae bacterium]|nr:FAD-binding oxidoreductase [Phycisphaerae bacterium]
MTTPLARDLEAIAGTGAVVDRDEARRTHVGDMSWLSIAAAAAGRPLSKPDAIVSPSTADHVAAIVRYAAARGIPVTPFGGGSGVQGAANADRGGIVVSMLRLHRVRSIARLSGIADVEAGAKIGALEDSLNAQGLMFPHYPASREWATLGGSIAARGSGVLSTKYGKIEDLVLSVDVVLGDGTLVTTPAVPRHGMGPELTMLFAGSEGTLGLIVAARIRVRPIPKVRIFASYLFDDLRQGVEAGRQMLMTGIRPPVLRLYDAHAATHSLERAVEAGFDRPAMILMFDGDHGNVVHEEAAAADEICRALGGIAKGSAPAERWWDRRYVFYYPPHAPQLPSIWCTMDVVGDYSIANRMYDDVTAAMRGAVEPRWNLSLNTHYSHWYDWGTMIYPRFKIPVGPASYDEALALHDAIVAAATKAALGCNAVLNDHHGVGMRLGRYMPAQMGAGGMTALAGIRKALDPKGVLCPGKLGG